MDTEPEIIIPTPPGVTHGVAEASAHGAGDTTEPKGRKPRPWRPFGDRPPMPRPGRRAVAAPRDLEPPPRRRRSLPLWFPPALALVLGGLIAIVVAFASSPSPPPVGPAPVVLAPPPPDPAGGPAALDDADQGLEADAPRIGIERPSPVGEAALTSDRPAADPRRVTPPRASTRARDLARGRITFDPRRVSDLKPNPFTDSLWGDAPHARWRRFERVGPLKANPFIE